MISRGDGLERDVLAQLEQPLEAARRDRPARAAPAPRSAPSASWRLSVVVLDLDVPQPDVAGPHAADAARRRPNRPRWSSEKTPKVTVSRTGTPALRVDLRGDEQDVRRG